MDPSVLAPPDRPRRVHAPVRTCVGCRRREEQAALLRVVAARPEAGPTGAWSLVPDERRRLPGRGAYVHPDPECVHTAIQRNAFGRALRLGGRPDSGELVRWVEQQRTDTVRPATAGR